MTSCFLNNKHPPRRSSGENSEKTYLKVTTLCFWLSMKRESQTGKKTSRIASSLRPVVFKKHSGPLDRDPDYSSIPNQFTAWSSKICHLTFLKPSKNQERNVSLLHREVVLINTLTTARFSAIKWLLNSSNYYNATFIQPYLCFFQWLSNLI